jgi:hypothetical protein
VQPWVGAGSKQDRALLINMLLPMLLLVLFAYRDVLSFNDRAFLLGRAGWRTAPFPGPKDFCRQRERECVCVCICTSAWDKRIAVGYLREEGNLFGRHITKAL